MEEGCGETIYVIGMGSGEKLTNSSREVKCKHIILQQWYSFVYVNVFSTPIPLFFSHYVPELIKTRHLVKLWTYLLFSSLLLHLSVVDGGDWGLDDKDMEASVATLRSMCEQLDADLIPLRERNEAAGLVRDYLIRRCVGELDFLEVR